jgi:biopolymer transport protein ExbD
MESPMWSPSRAAEQREGKRKSTAFVFLNLWPFAAILMFLLLIFLPIQPHGGRRQPPTDIPKSVSATTQPGARREDAIEIYVTRDGAVYFRQSATRLEDLTPALQSAIQEGAEKKAYVRADARAKNGDVEAVVDEIRRAGITQIAFLTN